MEKNPPANVEDATDVGSIPGSGRSHEVGNGKPLQDSCLKNPRDRGAWWPTVHEITNSYSPWGQKELDMSIHAL